ncbi:MAG: hypothetical protein NWF09_05125 [Candidatus Bathyarchaeota archaeon]|nr:hypothetical protein [Candidatus Bathyarchaeota archaeon]
MQTKNFTIHFLLLSLLLYNIFQASATTPFGIQVVDSEGTVGNYSSLALDSKGNPHIVYRDHSVGRIKYAKWTGSNWETTIIGGDYTWISFVLDSTDKAHIVYCDYTSIKYAKETAGNWEITTVDQGYSYYTSLALDANNNPHIAYNVEGSGVKYARWDGSKWIVTNVTSGVSHTSLAVDSKGNAHLLYYDDGLKYARWSGLNWVVQTVDSNAHVSNFKLVLDFNGHPHISYRGFFYPYAKLELRYARWTGLNWSIQVVDSTGYDFFQRGDNSLALDWMGNPHICYLDSGEGDLKYAKLTGLSWNIQVLDSQGFVGESNSIAIDSSGRAHISYFDNTNGDLKYVCLVASQFPSLPNIAVDDLNVGESSYKIIVSSNSTIQDLVVDQNSKKLSFYATGPDGSQGLCNLTVPTALIQSLWQGNYTVLVDGKPPTSISSFSNQVYTYIYVTYSHSTRKVEVVPEFSPPSMLIILVILSLIALIFKKRPGGKI